MSIEIERLKDKRTELLHAITLKISLIDLGKENGLIVCSELVEMIHQYVFLWRDIALKENNNVSCSK